MQKIEALVKGAVGFNQERGDQISIQNIPFQDAGDAVGSAESAQWWMNPFFLTLLKNLLIAVGFLALMMFVVKPMLNTLRAARPARPDILEAIAPDAQEKCLPASGRSLPCIWLNSRS